MSESCFEFVYQADCCLMNSGALIKVVSGVNASSCEALCLADVRCAFISRKEQLCALCATCVIRTRSGHFSSWSRTPLPHPVERLAPLLQGAYSISVYGSPGMVDMASLRIIWLPLLPSGGLRKIVQLGGVCKYESGYPWRPFFTALDIFANPLDAMWVSWERSPLAGFPVPNHSWIEVTHCPNGKHKVGAKGYGWQFGPMWLYVAPGSGVSINVGRSAVMNYPDAARLLRRVYPSALECACEPHCEWGLRPGSTFVPRGNPNSSSCIAHLRAVARTSPQGSSGGGARAHATGVTPQWTVARDYIRCWTRDAVLAELDTIQIVDHLEYFGRERRHEIVRLRKDSECTELTSSMPGVMCGKFPHLRRCPSNSTALRRLSACTSSKKPLSAGMGLAINFSGVRCGLRSSF